MTRIQHGGDFCVKRRDSILLPSFSGSLSSTAFWADVLSMLFILNKIEILELVASLLVMFSSVSNSLRYDAAESECDGTQNFFRFRGYLWRLTAILALSNLGQYRIFMHIYTSLGHIGFSCIYMSLGPYRTFMHLYVPWAI